MLGFLSGLAKFVCAAAIAVAGLWIVMALKFHPPFGAASVAAQVGAGLLALIAVASLYKSEWRGGLYAFLAVFAGALAWWSQIKPDPNRVWAPELARVFSYQIDGDTLLVDNVRNFDWRSESDFTERWERRSYRLSELEDVDFYAVYWMGPAIAHAIVSYGFKGGERLAFSIEVRHGPNDTYGMLTGLFKVDQLLYVAADERDLFTLRHFRKDDPFMFRTRIPADTARSLLIAYLKDGASLAAAPRFYNTATANCTTEIYRMAHAVKADSAWDWRVLVSGYFPDLLYDAWALNDAYSLAELRRLGRLEPYTPPFPEGKAFSAMIREKPPAPFALAK